MTNTSATEAIRLLLTFAAAGLQADLARIEEGEWTPHFKQEDYEGHWSGVALRSVGGRANSILPMMAPHELFDDTPLLARCPAFQQVLATLECPVNSARLLRLNAGARIKEHRDDKLGVSAGEVRLHVPVVTHPLVDFRLNGRRVEMEAGECWYLDLSLPHRCDNLSSISRVHLVVDCLLNTWLRELLGP